MTPYWSDDHLTLYGGDCRTVLAELPAESVHCVVTSPPYWGLRDYGTATWDGGDAACDHRNYPGAATGNKGAVTSTPMVGNCTRCGARRIDSQLGLEPTPEEYVANMVAVFREVRRVLRKDGTLWLNLGDSYATGAGAVGEHPGGGAQGSAWTGMRGHRGTRSGSKKHADGAMGPMTQPNRMPQAGLKPKDLVGIPWRVAFALQADGWYLRSDIIWAKPNPMPESVTDRPTKAHEYLFLLSKSPRYYFDAEAVREPHATWEQRDGVMVHTTGGNGRKRAGTWAFEDPGVAGAHPAGRNLRSVWTIATEPYPGAHFATFPRKLVEPCLKAGTSERGVCPECGAPWVRVVERTKGDEEATARPKHLQSARSTLSLSGNGSREWAERGSSVETTGWRPSCSHDDEPVPAVVLDPFAGSGTTLLVAQALGRRGIGIDLSPDYLKQALARNAQTPLGLVG